ncbi:unnamed protein product, partial [Ectocarpus sp. 12 AP-2014]
AAAASRKCSSRKKTVARRGVTYRPRLWQQPPPLASTTRRPEDRIQRMAWSPYLTSGSSDGEDVGTSLPPSSASRKRSSLRSRGGTNA